ncbi:MAG: glutamine amidotransferase family protein [Clostridiaceae bacterium]|jgi:glutamate synthase domain-containing protein 1|nr:glutamine amidotransferase family protein [Clostridiaceae bacterium]
MLKEGQIRIPSGCAISGVFNRDGKRVNGSDIITSISVMHDRSNGLGGGFAGYGIYPEYKDFFAFHVFFDSKESRAECEKYLDGRFDVYEKGEIPTRKHKNISGAPGIWRYFIKPRAGILDAAMLDEREFVARTVFFMNTEIKGAYVFSSGKNMGIFKAVGYPEDVGEYYRLEDYRGYSWTAHGRYPTNTPGWWGGAHPFGLLDLSVVHNGEISSYDANRRHMEMFGYKCTLLTDTEVITYILDYLVRKRGLTLTEASNVIAAPFWGTIEKMDAERKGYYSYLRQAFPEMLITGPFSILAGFEGGMLALNDRLKLRSMVTAEKDKTTYFASEECAIRIISPEIDSIRAPKGGEPVIVTLENGADNPQ